MSLPQKLSEPKAVSVLSEPVPKSACHLTPGPFAVPGEVRCPVCFHLVPPEHIGYKLHCRHCGYLESCCNPL